MIKAFICLGSENTDDLLDRLLQQTECSDSTAADEECHRTNPRSSNCLRSTAVNGLKWTFQLCVLMLALLGVRHLFESVPIGRAPSPSSLLPRCYCGESDFEAVSMGCIFDHLAVDWLPEECIDAEMTAEFVRSGPNPDGSWTFYADWDRVPESRLTSRQMEEYAKTGKDYYATKGWHVAHCMFTLRKQFRARTIGTVLEPWNDKEDHVMHCLEYIMDNTTSFDEIETKIPGWDRHGRGEIEKGS